MITPDQDIVRTAIWGFSTDGGAFQPQSNVAIHRYKTLTRSSRTPNYRYIKKGQLPIRYFFSQRLFEDCPMSSMVMSDVLLYPPFTATISDFILNIKVFNNGFPQWNDVPEEPVVEPCRAQLLKRLNTAKSALGVTVAEGHKTAAMVAKAATRIAGAVTALRRFDFPGVAQVLGVTIPSKTYKRLEARRKSLIRKSSLVREASTGQRLYDPVRQRYVYPKETDILTFLSKSWLEYAYGWKPLLSDVYSMAESFAELMTEHQKVIRTQSAKTKAVVNKQFSRRRLDLGESWYEVRNVTISTFCKIGVNYSYDHVSTADVFGLSNPLIIAWELVPFSFVVDWFLPVGKALECLTATNGLSFHSGYQTTRTLREASHQVFQDGMYTYPGFKTRTWSGSVKGTFLEVLQERTVMSSFPDPTWPVFKDPRSISHATSALALLTSLFK